MIRKRKSGESTQEPRKNVKIDHNSDNTESSKAGYRIITNSSSNEIHTDTYKEKISQSTFSDSFEDTDVQHSDDSVEITQHYVSEGPDDNVNIIHDELMKLIGGELMEPTQFTTVMFKKDIVRFNKVRMQGTEAEEGFIEDYIAQHKKDNVKTKDHVYSLLLTASISLENIELIKHILDIPHEENILTHVDDFPSSPISAALLSRDEDILDLIAKYIESRGSDIEKPNLSGKDTPSIKSVTSNPAFKDMEPIDCYRIYLEPLYSKKSLKEFADLIGLDNYSSDEEITE